MNKEFFFLFFNEHWIVLSAFFVSLIMTVVSFLGSQYQTLSPEVAIKKINEGAHLIDLREVEAFRKGHIRGAKNIPMSTLDESVSKIKQQHKNNTLLVYGDLNNHAVSAIKKLKKESYEGAVIGLRGGLSFWKESNYPLTKS